MKLTCNQSPQRQALVLLLLSKTLLFCCFAQTTSYQTESPNQLSKRSEDVAGLSAVIYLINPSSSSLSVATSRAELAYGFSTSNANTIACFTPDSPSLYCKIDLFDKDGKPQRKTRLGADFGRDFSTLATQAVFQASTDRSKYTLRAASLDLKTDYQKASTKKTNYVPRKISPLQKLFVFEKNGQYKVRIQIQTFIRDGSGARLVVFRPVEFEIQHNDFVE